MSSEDETELTLYRVADDAAAEMVEVTSYTIF